MTDSSLYLKYRPESWDELLGEETTKVVASMKHAIEEKRSHAFLLTGPSGVGKTTLARIGAKALGASGTNIQEIDAATHTGVENMRQITSMLDYRPLGAADVKTLIIDECHMLSKSAWNSILKSLEEPPNWAFWFLCTTQPISVPQTVRTRCTSYDLKPLNDEDCIDLLGIIRDNEKMETPDEVLQVCAQHAQGSARQAISNLITCELLHDRAAAAKILQSAVGEIEAVHLARALVAGKGWKEVRLILEKLEDKSAESVRFVVFDYVSKVAVGSKGEDQAARAMNILDAFSQPFPQAGGLGPLVLAVGRVVFA